jgi:uncharacterized BrkB/YihY/UPF0761 family membrane protein
MEKYRNMKQHVSFVGALHVGFGILGVVAAMAIYFGFAFLYNFIDNDPMAEKILAFIGNALALILSFFGSLGIIGGIGLFAYKAWARILVLIVSAMNCLNVPVGTAKGVYSIWVLMQPETIELFDTSKQS